ncbi:MAG: hypothetical protein QXK12_08335 [Candidatus Nezhaarchaeales archaeon]
MVKGIKRLYGKRVIYAGRLSSGKASLIASLTNSMFKPLSNALSVKPYHRP